MRRILLTLVFAVSLLPVIAFADRASSTNFILETGVIDVGGGNSTSTGFNLKGSLGQPAPGVSSSTSFILLGGFLNFPLISAAPPPLLPPTLVVIPVPGGGGGGTGYYLLRKKVPILPKCFVADLNCDGWVDIVDLSVLLYFYGETGPTIAPYDFNGDGTINLPDISIMMYYWAG